MWLFPITIAAENVGQTVIGLSIVLRSQSSGRSSVKQNTAPDQAQLHSTGPCLTLMLRCNAFFCACIF